MWWFHFLYPIRHSIFISIKLATFADSRNTNTIGYIFSSIPHDLFWTAVSGFVGLLLVMLTKVLEKPDVEIHKIDPVELGDGRKLLKIKVTLSKSKWITWFYPWQNSAATARVRGLIIIKHKGREEVLQQYTVKWDSKPEPWDYSTGRPNLALLPAASEPENFLVNDEGTASVVVKHKNDPNFYLYDANYYMNQSQNVIKEKEVLLRLIFSSSSATASRDFVIYNPSKDISNFELSEYK